MFGKCWRNRPLRNICRLNLEALETRLTPDVSASVLGGNLVVLGDSGYNQVFIQQTDNNEFSVVGTGFPLSKFPDVTGNVDVSMAGADDKVSLGVRNAPGNIGVLFNGAGGGVLDLHTNAPESAQAVVNGGLNVESTKAAGGVYLSGVDLSGNVAIALGTGQGSVIDFKHARITGTTDLTTNGGADYVDVESGTILYGDTTVDLHSTGHLFFDGAFEAGDLTVLGYAASTDVELRMGSVFLGKVGIGLGAGDDSTAHDYFVLDGSNIVNSLTVLGGNQANTVLLNKDSIVNGLATFSLREGGPNTFQLQGKLNGGMEYHGSKDDDTLTLGLESLILGGASVDLGDGQNSFTLERGMDPLMVRIDNLRVTTDGSGNNTLSLDGVTGHLEAAFFGTGYNTVLLTSPIVAGVTITGGDGGDYIYMGDGCLIGGDVFLNPGNGPNQFTFSGFITGGSLTYVGGSGPDTVYLAGLGVEGDVSINMGQGQNYFSFSGNISDGQLVYWGGTEQDTVVFAGQVSGEVDVNLKGGNSIFYLMPGEKVSGIFHVDGGGGNSTFDGTGVGGRGDVTTLENFTTILP